MSIVSNTGPLIALAKVDRLVLLKNLFGQVCIPDTVQRELLAKASLETSRLELVLSTFVLVKQVSQVKSEVLFATRQLDTGERDAVVLAYQLGVPLILDDRLGRQAARRLSIPVSGVVGVLIKARHLGMITSVHDLLNDMRANGYWFSDELILHATKLAGES